MSDTEHFTHDEPADLNEKQRKFFAQPWIEGRYENPWDVMPQPHPKKLIKWKMEENPWKQEKYNEQPPNPMSRPIEQWHQYPTQTKVLFNGHATFMVQVDDVRVLIDPVFGSASFAVPRQHASPLSISNTPDVDAILLTHGHYDHFESRVLKGFVKRFGQDVKFVVPKGLDAYLPKQANVVTLNWWQAIKIRSVEITFVPSQHWHRRGINDYNKALWGGWSIRGAHHIYHMGDSGYFGGFDMVRRTLGTPDLAFLPMGAYEPRWFMSYQHMAPEEALQAWDDLQASHVIPMHWGTFDLSNEPLHHGPNYFKSLLSDRHRQDDLKRFHQVTPGETIGLDGQEFVRG